MKLVVGTGQRDCKSKHMFRLAHVVLSYHSMSFLVSSGDFAPVDQYMLDPYQPYRAAFSSLHLPALPRPVLAKRFVPAVERKGPRYLVMLLLM